MAHCEACFISIKKSEEEFLKAAEELIERNCLLLKPNEDLALVLFATPGPIGFYLGESGGAGDGLPTLGMHTFKLPFHRYRPWVEHGVELLTSSILQPSPLSINPSIKQRSRMHWWIAEREVKKRSATAMALLLDENGFLTETASSNLIILQDASKSGADLKIFTPKPEKVLDGIGLRIVKSFARDCGFSWIESDILPTDVKSEDAAIITSNSFCFAPVKSLNGIQLSRFKWFNEKLLGYWQKQVHLDFHDQILKNL
jgi:branched-subunit amino acid aminotransferase/4-amino-4-deoxychorismate lyase